MGRREKLLTKAVKKIILTNTLIRSLEEINELEEYENMKQYSIILDYKDESDYTNFFVTIQKNKHRESDNIFDIKFCLDNKQDGLDLFQKLRQNFVKRDSIQFTGFNGKFNTITDHFIKKNSNIELKTVIKNDDDLENLKEYNDIINQSKVFGYKRFNPSGKTKDELQLFKAKTKANIICNIISTISELNNLEENRNNMKDYKVNISYNVYNDLSNGTYYKYNINLIKNSIKGNKTLLNFNFSLKNHKDGLDIITEIINNFNLNTEVILSTFNSKGNSSISNKSNIEIITELKTDSERAIFDNLHKFLQPDVIDNSNNLKVKKIEKK